MTDFNKYEPIHELTDDTLLTMFNFQALATASALTTAATHGYSDDDIDYIPAALDLTHTLMMASYELCPFTLYQLRRHVAFLPCDDVSPHLIHMLYDDDAMWQDFRDRDIARDDNPRYDNVNPETIDT